MTEAALTKFGKHDDTDTRHPGDWRGCDFGPKKIKEQDRRASVQAIKSKESFASCRLTRQVAPVNATNNASCACPCPAISANWIG